MKTAKLTLRVSVDRLDEWQEWVESVPPTTQNPVARDRILTAARAALEMQEKRRGYKRDYYRKTLGKGARRKRGK